MQPPTAVDPSIPVAVSHIVMKLLEKDAEARYQTAAGLRADLQKCLDLLAKGDLQPFPLGRLDHVGESDVCQMEGVQESGLLQNRTVQKSHTSSGS